MMNEAKMRRVFVGGTLIFLSLLTGAVAIYYLEKDTRNVTGAGKISELKASEEQLARRAVEIEKEISNVVQETKRREAGSAQEIPLRQVMDVASETYAPEESSRREGLLWIDEETSQYVATLGAMNGVLPGKRLVIYDGGKKIGVAVVDTSFDVISYVKPSLDSGSLGKGYYKVLAE